MWKPNFLAIRSVAVETLKVVKDEKSVLKPKFYVPLKAVVIYQFGTDRYVPP